MAVTVSDLLSLPLLREGQIVAGVGGLTKQVRAVSFSDYPIIFSEEEYKLTSEGDLYICSYYLFQEDKEKLYNRIRFYTKTKSSCFIISISEQVDLPADSIALANENNYPIVLISDKIPYTAIIRTISEAIFLDETSYALEKKVDSLLYDNLSLEEESALAKHFYTSVAPYYLTAFFSLEEAVGISRLGDVQKELTFRFSNREFTLCRYKKQLCLLVIPIEMEKDFTSVKKLLRVSLEYLGIPYYLGISGLHRNWSEFSAALRESYKSCRIGLYQRRSVTEFGQVPLADMLYDLRHSAALICFCQETLRPLWDYKRRHNIDLVETLRVFFRNDGSYKQTAVDLFLHENTVRFRVDKAKSLLGMEKDSCRFIKEVSLAIDCLLFLKEK